jgi:hypothetical protein
MTSRDKAPDLEKTKGFLSRWSQRKLAAEPPVAPELAEPTRQTPDAVPDGEGQRSQLAEIAPADSEPDEIDPKDLPDIDSLDKDSDYTVFLKRGVPKALRQRALRKLWRIDPVLGFIDGLDDYNLDYTDAATVMPNMKTLYQVGRGMVLPEEEKAEQEAAEQLAEDEAALARAPADDPADDPAAGSAGETDDETGATVAALPPEESPLPDVAAPKKRQRNPGDPVVTGAATRRSDPARPAARSARSRRWGDPDPL